MSNEAPIDALRLVPLEPTIPMLNAAWTKVREQGFGAEDVELDPVWSAMLAAAPASPLPGGGQCSGISGELKFSDLDALEKRLIKAKEGQAYRSVRHRHDTYQVSEPDIDAAVALISELRDARSTVEELLYAHTDKSIAISEAFLAHNEKGEG